MTTKKQRKMRKDGVCGSVVGRIQDMAAGGCFVSYSPSTTGTFAGIDALRASHSCF